MTSYQVTNPATGQIEEQYNSHSNQEIQDIITESHSAYQSWRTCDVNARANPNFKQFMIYSQRIKKSLQ